MTDRNIYVTQPTLAPLDDVDALLKKVWESGIMTHNGPLVQEFEKQAAQYLHVDNLAAVSNGTVALQMAIQALRLRGEIITTPFTFIATVSSILWEGCTPVFVDIDADTFNMDAKRIEERISKNTVAVMPVHVFGNICDVDEIDVLAKRNKLKVIYDAAHAFGVQYKGKSIFDYGDVSATSFHATKMLNTAEGGACITTDRNTFEELRRIRFFGFDEEKDVVTDGFNGKMTEVHAAIGLANLKLMDAALEDRRQKYALYKEGLSASGKLSFQKITHACNYSYFPVLFQSERQLLECEKKLNEQHYYPRRYFYPSLNTCRNIIPYIAMPVSESIASRILCLPLYYTLDVKHIYRIVDIINASVAGGTA